MGRKSEPDLKSSEELLSQLDGAAVDYLASFDPPIVVEAYTSGRRNLVGVRILVTNEQGEAEAAGDRVAATVQDAFVRVLWEALVLAVPEDGKIGSKQQQSEAILVLSQALALALGDKGEEGNATIDDIQALCGDEEDEEEEPEVVTEKAERKQER